MRLLAGPPPDGTEVAVTTISQLADGATTGVEFEWTDSADRSGADLYVQVLPGVGQYDPDGSNNLSAGTHFRSSFANYQFNQTASTFPTGS